MNLKCSAAVEEEQENEHSSLERLRVRLLTGLSKALHNGNLNNMMDQAEAMTREHCLSGVTTSPEACEGNDLNSLQRNDEVQNLRTETAELRARTEQLASMLQTLVCAESGNFRKVLDANADGTLQSIYDMSGGKICQSTCPRPT